MNRAKHVVGLLLVLSVCFLLQSYLPVGEYGYLTEVHSSAFSQVYEPVFDTHSNAASLVAHYDSKLAVYKAQERELAASTDIFSTTRLPCDVPKAPLPPRPARAPFASHTKVGVFWHRQKLNTSRYTDGTAMMRATLQSAALSMVPGWSSYMLSVDLPDEFKIANQSWSLEFCVFVKWLMHDIKFIGLLQWCKDNGAKAIYWDVLDNSRLVQVASPEFQLDDEVDVLTNDATQTHSYRKRWPARDVGPRKGMPRAFTLYHGHSNLGFVLSLKRFSLPYVCRLALVHSNHNAKRSKKYKNGLSIDMAMDIGCQASTVWEVAVVEKVANRTWRHDGMFVYSRRCSNRSLEMQRACMALDEETDRERRENEKRQQHHAVLAEMRCYEDQKAFHCDPMLNYHVDVLLTIPIRTSVYYEHLPSTKMTYLASHGVPHVFWRYQSYIDLAEDWDYRLPFSHKLPVVSDDLSELIPILEELGNSTARLHLRERGLRHAADYSVLGSAHQMVAIHEGRNT